MYAGDGNGRRVEPANCQLKMAMFYPVAIVMMIILQFFINAYAVHYFDSSPLISDQKEHIQINPAPILSAKGQSKKESPCCVMCTSPKDKCCLRCAEVSSLREHDLLMTMMEGLTHHTMDKHISSSKHAWLKTRAWEGNSHIGNRPKQATYYYDWVRTLARSGNEKVDHICEIGMNGGHSALVFLAALTHNDNQTDAKLTMFDFFQYDYSLPVKKYIETMYPRRFNAYKGNSQIIVPEWTMNHKNDKCDVFSVDGDHTYEGAKIDILNAAKATRKGGMIILDDMKKGGQPRRALEYAFAQNVVKDTKCVEGVTIKVGHDDRIDDTNSRKMILDWCSATVV